MRKEWIERYKDLCDEIKSMELIAATEVKEVVSSSSEDYPFIKRSVTVRGIPEEARRAQRRLEKLRALQAEIEDFIDSLDSPRQRRLIRCVMKYGRKWEKVRRAMKDGRTPDALRVEFDRIFKSKYSTPSRKG